MTKPITNDRAARLAVRRLLAALDLAAAAQREIQEARAALDRAVRGDRLRLVPVRQKEVRDA